MKVEVTLYATLDVILVLDHHDISSLHTQFPGLITCKWNENTIIKFLLNKMYTDSQHHITEQIRLIKKNAYVMILHWPVQCSACKWYQTSYSREQALRKQDSTTC